MNTQLSEQLADGTHLIDFQVHIPTLEGNAIAETRTIKVPARRSQNGSWILTSEAMDLIEQTQARYMGLMTPEEIKALRLRIQLTQREMSELIQAGEKSYTRWETGKVRLSRLVNIVLCAIRDGFLPVMYLQTLYRDGSDWFKKVSAYEAQTQAPVTHRLTQIPAVVDLTQSVFSTVHYLFRACVVNCRKGRLFLRSA